MRPPTISLTLNIYFGLIDFSKEGGERSSYQLRISAYQLTEGICQKYSPINSKGEEREREETEKELSVPHVRFLESRVLSNLIGEDLILFSLKCGGGGGGRVLYACGQVRTLSSGIFILPLRSEKGLKVDMRIRIVGEVLFD